MFPSEDPDKVSGGGWDYHRRSTWRDWSFEGLDLERLKVGEWFFFAVLLSMASLVYAFLGGPNPWVCKWSMLDSLQKVQGYTSGNLSMFLYLNNNIWPGPCHRRHCNSMPQSPHVPFSVFSVLSSEGEMFFAESPLLPTPLFPLLYCPRWRTYLVRLATEASAVMSDWWGLPWFRLWYLLTNDILNL